VALLVTAGQLEAAAAHTHILLPGSEGACCRQGHAPQPGTVTGSGEALGLLLMCGALNQRN